MYRMLSLHRFLNKPLSLLHPLTFLCNASDTCTVVQTLAHTSYTFIGTHPQLLTKSTVIVIKKKKKNPAAVLVYQNLCKW